MKSMETKTMLLTRKMLGQILQDEGVSIPAQLEKEILHEYGNLVTDDEGHVLEYTEQDTCEQLRKKVRSYQDADKEVKHFTLC